MQLTSNLSVLLAARKLKHKDVAEKIGVTSAVFSTWVNDRSLPSATNLFLLAQILECKVDDLYNVID